jgi:deoxyribonuclease V
VLHSWNLSTKEAVALQRDLATRVRLRPLPESISLVAGADVGYCRQGDTAVAAVALYSFPALACRELVQVQAGISCPYIPGLLSFREIPVLLEAFQQLSEHPEVVLCDGQGVAHPRRLGLASHLGLWLELPTVGCAKTRLVGSHGRVGPRRGQYRSLVHRGERVGVVLRTRSEVKPLYVSPGHLADVEGCRRLVQRCCLRTRIPEPVRRAHLTVQRSVRGNCEKRGGR